MSKRDLAFLSATANVDLSEPRTKRRKETQSEEKEDVEMVDDTKLKVEDASGTVNKEGSEEVKEQGNRLWQAVKDAVNKECVTGNSFNFVFGITVISLLFLDLTQWPNNIFRVPAITFKTPIPRLLHTNQATNIVG